MTATRRLAEALIARPSVTPAHGGCIDLIAERLTPLGFVPHVIDSGPADWRVRNLWSKRVPALAGRAPQAIKTIVFAGHVDVVPPGPAEARRSPPRPHHQNNPRQSGPNAADQHVFAWFLARTLVGSGLVDGRRFCALFRIACFWLCAR